MSELHRKFPSIEREDIVLGCHTPDDGWIDPRRVCGFWRAAEHLGVQYIKARVTDIVSSEAGLRRCKLMTDSVLQLISLSTPCG